LSRVEEREGLGGQYLELGSGGNSNYAHQQSASQLRVQQIHQVTTTIPLCFSFARASKCG
jgi:hypothetical protein